LYQFKSCQAEFLLILKGLFNEKMKTPLLKSDCQSAEIELINHQLGKLKTAFLLPVPFRNAVFYSN